MKLSRREMLKISAGAGAAIYLNRLEVLGQESEMIRRTIPSSGEQIPAVGLGSARTFDVGTSAEERAPLKEVLRLFVEKGGTLVDSSPMYGNSEVVIGDLAAELRVTESLFTATKVWTRGRDQGISQMGTSLELFRTDQIDLMQVHNLRDAEIHLATLREWKAAGRIRYIGITTSSIRQFAAVEQLLSTERLDFVQLNYSIGIREAEKRLLPLAQDRGVAVLVNEPYYRGRLFSTVAEKELPEWAAEFDCESWGQFFLKYILSHPAVTCPIPATAKPNHLADNMGAMYGRLPDEGMRGRMVAYFEAQ